MEKQKTFSEQLVTRAREIHPEWFPDMVIVQDEDGSYQPAIIDSRNDDGTVTVIMSNRDYSEE